MKTKIFTVFLLGLGLALPATARENKNPAPPPPAGPQEITLPVPTSQIEVPEPQDRNGSDAQLELAYSSWFPTEFSRPKLGSGPATFERGSYPLVSISRLSPLVKPGARFSLYSRFGVASISMERTETFTQPVSGPYTASQNLRLASLRVGVEGQGPQFLKILRPFVGYSLLPTLALASESPVEGNGVSKLGLPMEADAGLLAQPRFLTNFLGMQHGTLGLAGHGIFGTVDNSRMNDLGVEAFVRVDL